MLNLAQDFRVTPPPFQIMNLEKILVLYLGKYNMYIYKFASVFQFCWGESSNLQQTFYAHTYTATEIDTQSYGKRMCLHRNLTAFNYTLTINAIFMTI